MQILPGLEKRTYNVPSRYNVQVTHPGGYMKTRRLCKTLSYNLKNNITKIELCSPGARTCLCILCTHSIIFIFVNLVINFQTHQHL